MDNNIEQGEFFYVDVTGETTEKLDDQLMVLVRKGNDREYSRPVTIDWVRQAVLWCTTMTTTPKDYRMRRPLYGAKVYHWEERRGEIRIYGMTKTVAFSVAARDLMLQDPRSPLHAQFVKFHGNVKIVREAPVATPEAEKIPA
ncbi:MAG TPA: hypothetical protein VH593_06115 [Ktedonobacteraceae bacterium]